MAPVKKLVPPRRRKQNKAKKSKQRAKRRQRRRGMTSMSRALALTPSGMEFLKCTIAPRDFPGSRPAGVPDEFSGPSLTYRHQGVFTIVLNSNVNTFLFLPTPGVAFWTAANDVAPMDFTAFPFADFSSAFGDITVYPFGTANFEKFRIISHTVEIKPVSAILNNSGAISFARVPGISVNEQVLAPPVGASNSVTRFIVGLDALSVAALSAQPGFYNGHINDGLYAWTFNEGGEWDFSSVWVNTQSLTSVDVGGLNQYGLTGSVMGWGNTVPMAAVISGSSASTTIQIMVETCIEYLPKAGTILAHTAGPSPPHDPLALESYAKAGRHMPAAVPAAKNDGFWNTFLKIVSTGASLVAPLFGPLGAGIATGVSAITNGLSSLFV